MKYTSRHYKEMSGFFSSLLKRAQSETDTQAAIIMSIASALMFAEDNPEFDKDAYLKACGLT